MLLRYGVIAMSFSVVLALVVVAILTLRDGSEEVVAAEAAASSPEPTTEQTYQDPRDKMLDLPDPEPKSEPSPVSPEPVAQSEPQSNPVPRSEPESTPEPEPQTATEPQGSLPVVEEDWPVPDSGEIEATNQPRRYDWVPGAIMTLTVDSMQIYNAPVMGNDSQQALDSGIVHVPETSLPWTRSPHRNVYLAGHRLGWPGTGAG